MQNDEIFQTENGLRVCYVEKKKFRKSYVGIGLNYGSRDLKFFLDEKEITSKEGTAHFIEHKLFEMPYGDAFTELAKLNAHANAYTDLEKTIYYFTTCGDLYAPLKVLLEMFFTPYFNLDSVEREKSIIHSEIDMYDDVPDAKFSRKILKTLFPKCSLSSDVAGTVQSVSRITALDLERAYCAFYTTDNSYLVIVSSQPRQKVYSFVNEVMKKCIVHRGLPKRKEDKIPLECGSNFVMQARVEQSQAALAIRFSANQDMPLFCSFIIGILDSLLSPATKYYKNLHSKKAFSADIDYYVMTLRDTSYAVISTTSKLAKLFLSSLESKLKSLSKKDLDKRVLELYLKHLKAKRIRALDSIEELGEEILILALENASYLEELELSQNLNIEDFYEYLNYFKTAEYIQAICKKSAKSH
ncbi:MAG: insulinase family protein [Roseburia sp.]|nr:insulinase family protein [Anaeroplasma bactoclasticum]MCM1196115.1 insulinase family protein [Roseburia sp.]MCM1556003.1 insulinase family protein [Anaeroplasma bactoclasticum]